MATVQTTVATVKTTAKGNKCLSITLIVFGSVGLLTSIVAIIYSAVGANMALEASNVKNLQKACADTFSTAIGLGGIKSYDSGVCTTGITQTKAPLGGTFDMCGESQKSAGCSYSTHETAFKVASGLGTAATIAGSFFVIMASIPILLNGIFGFLNNETAAKTSGGFGVGCSVPGVIGAAICVGVTLFATAAAKFFAAGVQILRDYKPNSPVCTPECKEALDATATLGDHIINYYSTLTVMLVIMILVTFTESIMACVSCCFWKKKTEVQVAVVAPAPAPVVTAEPVTVKVEA